MGKPKFCHVRVATRKCIHFLPPTHSLPQLQSWTHLSASWTSSGASPCSPAAPRMGTDRRLSAQARADTRYRHWHPAEATPPPRPVLTVSACLSSLILYGVFGWDPMGEFIFYKSWSAVSSGYRVWPVLWHCDCKVLRSLECKSWYRSAGSLVCSPQNASGN